MLTDAAERSLPWLADRVVSRAELASHGIGPRRVDLQCAARRWQVVGLAVVLHNGVLTRQQRWQVVRINTGPQAVLTAFTAAEAHGLRGWERDTVHVLGSQGTPRPRIDGIRLRLHRTKLWAKAPRANGVHAVAPALVIAASTFATPRPACGILAAGVQQRLTGSAALLIALTAAPRVRHRRAMFAAVDDIAQGSQALSEIDFYALCRRYGLPLPERQTMRRDSSGRRRYLDATWRRSDGRLVVAEVDGALHLDVSRWWDDQYRQNELSLADALVLRFPSVVVRTEPEQVARQLRRALGVERS